MNFKVQKIKFDTDGTKVNMLYTMNDPEDAQSKEEHDTTLKGFHILILPMQWMSLKVI